MGGRRQVFRVVFRSPALRRVELAFLAFGISEWATWVAIIVFAYGRGGAGEAGLVAAISLAPSLIVAPAASTLGDRYPRPVVLLGAYGCQGAAMGIVAASLLLGGPPLLTYALYAVAGTTFSLTRPLQASLLPQVVSTPDELTAANVASGTIESAGSLVGPIVASVLIGLGGSATVFVVASVAMLASAATVLPVAQAARRAIAAVPVPDGDLVPLGAIHSEMMGGLRAIAADRRLLAVAVASASGSLMLGALDILYAVLAFDVLDMGEEGVGLLGAATGVGALVGSVVSVALVGRRALAPPLVAATCVMGLAIIAIGLVAAPPVVGVLLAVGGTAFTVIAVAGQTFTQRLAPPAALTRVFGLFEASMMGMTALGALIVPLLVSFGGPTGALLIAGAAMPVVAVLVLGPLRAADRSLVVPVLELRLLAGVPMLVALSAPVLERLARSLVPISYLPGAAVIREGERGDRFYVIVAGRVEISVAGRVVRERGPGDTFGEIALLRDVPRTATVTALEAVELYALEREPFLEAITGHLRSRAIAEAEIDDRLATAG